MKNKILPVILGFVALIVGIVATLIISRIAYSKLEDKKNNEILSYMQQISELEEELASANERNDELDVMLADAETSSSNDNSQEASSEETRPVVKYERPPEKDKGVLSAYSTPVILVEYEGHRYGYMDTALNIICVNEDRDLLESGNYAILLQNSMFDRTAGFAVSYVIRIDNEPYMRFVDGIDDPDELNTEAWKDIIPEDVIIKLEESDYVSYMN